MNLFKANIIFDGERTCLHYYLCAYLTRHFGRDALSESILNFKKMHAHDVNAWVDCAVKRLKPLRLGGLLVIRALHSDETLATGKGKDALDQLGKAIADKYHGQYLPMLLTKTRPTKPFHQIATKSEREHELADVYQVDCSLTDLKDRRILLVDDVVTTGVTARTIIRALKAAERSVFVIAFSLACTDYDPAFNVNLELRGNTYNWNQDNSWTVQEPSLRYLPKLLAAQDRNFNFGDPDTFVF